ncbi:hypothetical protein TNCV_1480891 [Trichonephila clavipes]|nr:hypothetical protein TNCV_1480891 [Trichonephila clavipes]
MPFTRRPGSGRPRQTSRREATTSENPDSISAVMTMVFVCGEPRGERLNPAFALQLRTTSTARVMEEPYDKQWKH